jgi:hypothetical protein
MHSGNIIRTVSLALAASAWLSGQVSVLTNRNDIARTGANLNETQLTTSNVNPGLFGKLFSQTVDGSIYAQPLYVPGVAIGGQGAHNTVYIATMNDKVYAFDADSNTGANSSPLWSQDLATPYGGTPIPIGNLTNGYTTGNIIGNVGIESTPVIDLSTNTMYLLARTMEGSHYVQRLHALDITSGAEKFGGPVVIAASVPGTGVGSSGGTLAFDPQRHNQRSALALTNGLVIISWASHEDYGLYHGWIMAYNASTLQQAGVLNTTPNGSDGGIWQAGRGPVIDSSGNIYVITGNGTWDGSKNFGDSMLKLGTSGTLTLEDWFTPDDQATLNSNDWDLGSSGLLLIPGTNLVAGGGKEGKLYLLNTASLGHEQTGNGQIVQVLQAAPTAGTNEIKSGLAYWNSPNHGPLIYLWADGDDLRVFHFNGSTLDTTPIAIGTIQAAGSPGGMLSISANGSAAGTGILWVGMAVSQNGDHGVVSGVLRAFDASNPTTELWDSQQNSARDGLGNLGKFVPPTIANGKVYMATFSNSLVVYGLLSSDFALLVSPSSQAVVPGSAVTYTVAVSGLGGFTGSVSLSAGGLPSGVSASFSPATVSGSGSSSLLVSAASGVTLGSYPLTISGVSGAVTHTAPATLVVSSSSAPNAISINFVGRGTAMAASESAGVVAKTNWNNASGVSGSGLSLHDETGVVGAASVAWSSNNVWSTSITDAAGNFRMMKGYLDTSNTSVTTITVSGLPSHAAGYTVYAYFDGDNGSATRKAAFKIAGAGITTTTIDGTDASNTNFSGTFKQANSSAGNYVKFTINASGFTLTATPLSSTDSYPRAPLNGIQIIPD